MPLLAPRAGGGPGGPAAPFEPKGQWGSPPLRCCDGPPATPAAPVAPVRVATYNIGAGQASSHKSAKRLDQFTSKMQADVTQLIRRMGVQVILFQEISSGPGSWCHIIQQIVPPHWDAVAGARSGTATFWDGGRFAMGDIAEGRLFPDERRDPYRGWRRVLQAPFGPTVWLSRGGGGRGRGAFTQGPGPKRGGRLPIAVSLGPMPKAHA